MKQIILINDILINKNLILRNAMTKEIENNILEKNISENTIGLISVCYDSKNEKILHCLIGYKSIKGYEFGYFYDYHSISKNIIYKIKNGDGKLLYNCQDNLSHKLSLLPFSYKKKMETIVDGSIIRIQKESNNRLILETQTILNDNNVTLQRLVSIRKDDIFENIDLIYNEIATYLYCYKNITLGNNIFEWK